MNFEKCKDHSTSLSTSHFVPIVVVFAKASFISSIADRVSFFFQTPKALKRSLKEGSEPYFGIRISKRTEKAYLSCPLSITVHLTSCTETPQTTLNTLKGTLDAKFTFTFAYMS